MMFENAYWLAHLLLAAARAARARPAASVARSRIDDDAGRIEIRFFDEVEGAGLPGFERARDRADCR